MKKEFGIMVLIIGYLIFSMFYIFYDKTEVKSEKPLIGEVRVLKKDTSTFNCNDAVLVKFNYAYMVTGSSKRDSISAKTNAMNSLQNFARSQDSEYFYKLETPHKLSNNLIINKVTLEAEVLDRIKKREADANKFINIIVKEIEKDGWEITEMRTDTYSLVKGDFRIVSAWEYSYLTFTKVKYKGDEVKLTKKEEAIIMATIMKKLAIKKHTKNKKVRQEILEKFGN